MTQPSNFMLRVQMEFSDRRLWFSGEFSGGRSQNRLYTYNTLVKI
jgi:hypothetical protein